MLWVKDSCQVYLIDKRRPDLREQKKITLKRAFKHKEPTALWYLKDHKILNDESVQRLSDLNKWLLPIMT